MKIGLVIYGSLDIISGGYMYDRRLVEYLRSQGDEVEIISLHWRNYLSHLSDNFTFRLPKHLDILIEDELNHPSLVFANRKPHSYPIVSLVHHLRCSELRPKWLNYLYRLVERKYLQSVDGFIFNSQTTKNVVNEIIGNDKPEIVAYPPTDRFGDGNSEAEIEGRSKLKELRILFVGNVIYRKGLHTLLEAVKNLRSKIRVEVVGGLNSEPKYAKQIQEYIQVNDLSSSVFLHGALNNEPLIEMYKKSHVMIVPSSYEGFGIVYLEGMCFGLPAIGTTAGAAGEIIEQGKTGYLIEPGDSKTLAEHIAQLASDRRLLVELSINAKRRFAIQPKWNETAGKIRNYLESMAI